jgi:peptide/nickel transport system substrate-binding protein
MRRILLALSCAAALLPMMAQAQTAPPSVMRIALREDPDLLDPALGQTYVGRIVFAGLCDKLFDINEKLQIVPQLATGYEWADPKTLVIHLRPNVSFQDGETMDAAAVKYTLERDLTLQGSVRRGEIGLLDHVDVVDPLTVRLVLKQPSSPFLAQLTDRAGMIVAPKAAQSAGTSFATHPVCAGPFSFGERVAEDHITLNRFPGYWDKDAIHFDQVIYRVIPDSSVRLANLQAGSIDLVEYIVPTDVDAVRKDQRLKLAMSDNLGYESIQINVGNGDRAKTALGSDPRVRRAFDLSIDRAALNQVVYNGLFTPTDQAVPPSSPYYIQADKPPTRDVARAKALLKEAGVQLPVPVELMAAPNPDIRQVAEVIQSMAAEAGFDVKINTVEFATSLQTAMRGDFQAYLIGWSGRVDPDGNMYSFLHSGQPLNYGRYANADVDNLLDQARTVSDIGQRQAIYTKLWAQVLQDDPTLYLWTPKNIVGMSAKVDGFRPVPDGMIRLQGLSIAH